MTWQGYTRLINRSDVRSAERPAPSSQNHGPLPTNLGGVSRGQIVFKCRSILSTLRLITMRFTSSIFFVTLAVSRLLCPGLAKSDDTEYGFLPSGYECVRHIECPAHFLPQTGHTSGPSSGWGLPEGSFPPPVRTDQIAKNEEPPFPRGTDLCCTLRLHLRMCWPDQWHRETLARRAPQRQSIFPDATET